MKERDRREMEKAEERARKQYEECNRASEGEKNAATLVSHEQQKYRNLFYCLVTLKLNDIEWGLAWARVPAVWYFVGKFA